MRQAIVAALPCTVVSAARADEEAPEPLAAPVVAAPHREHAGCGGGGRSKVKTGARVTGGALVGGPWKGGYGRFDLEIFQGSIRRAEVLVGVAPLSVGGWGGGGGGGGGLGSWGFVGYATPSLFATVGCGADWVIYDRVAGDGGAGVVSPFAVANLGHSSRKLRLFFDARVQRRFHFGLPAETQTGVGVGVMLKLD